MSLVLLIASNLPLPACDLQEEREYRHGNEVLRCPGGLKIEPLLYYRDAVEDLAFPMKPWRYELSIDPIAEDCTHLRQYLKENVEPGATLELWSLWVGGGPGRLHRFRGTLAELDPQALEVLSQDRPGLFEDGQVCISLCV